MRALPTAIASLALAACGGDDSGEPDAAPIGTPEREVTRYEYELDLETRAAATTLTVRTVDAGNCIALPSRAANLDLGSVRLDDVAAVATWDGATLTACMPPGQGFAAGDHTLRATITQQPLERWAPSQVGYTVTPDGAMNPQSYYYLISWVGGCDRFGPCDTNPGVFAHYRFTIRHRAGVRALCPGTITSAETSTVCEFTHDGGPTYSTFGFIAYASWAETSRGSWGGVDVTLYERPGTTYPVAAAIDDAYHAGFITWMQDTFGPYPYGDTLRIVVAPTYWSGFEHPGNIVLNSGLARPNSGSAYTRPVAHVLNHEIAHQWAGDQTTLAGTYDFVWKEAMAEYLAYVYEDMTFPAEAAATARAWRSFAGGALYHPVPEEQPPLLDYYGEVYGPGPLILFRQLEGLSSRAQVLAGIAAVLGTERRLSVDDLQAALEASTGLELDTYFDVWIRGTGAPVWPTFTAVASGGVGAQVLTVTETTPGGVIHGCNFDVELRGAQAGEVQRVAVARGVNGVATIDVPAAAPFAITSTVIDPDARCLGFTDASPIAPPRLHPPGWTPWRGSINSP